jgi:hypothetical protein
MRYAIPSGGIYFPLPKGRGGKTLWLFETLSYNLTANRGEEAIFL